MRDFLKSFLYAGRGILFAVKTERNMRFHLCFMLLVIFFSRFYGLSRGEYALLFVIFSLVISAETINTAVENTVDLISKEKSETAKNAKDTAAGAVLITAAGAVAAGTALFWDTSVFGEIISFFVENPLYIVLLILYLAASAVFVFLPKKERKIK